MKLNLTLESNKDIAYGIPNTEYKFRGLLYNSLDGVGEITEIHNDFTKTPFTFSNIYPPQETISKGSIVHIDITSQYEQFIRLLQSKLTGSEIRFGEHSYTVIDSQIQSSGVPISKSLSTPTGVYCTVNDDTETPTYWRPEHGVNTFIELIESDLDDKIATHTTHNPSDRDFTVFNEVDFERTSARPVQLSQDTTHTIIVSKWTLSYTIQNQLHETYISLAQNSGIGGRNTLSFGYLL